MKTLVPMGLVLMVAVACGPDNEPGPDPVRDRDQIPDARTVPPPPSVGEDPVSEPTMNTMEATGTIQAVDLEARTFTLDTGVDEMELRYSEATEIEGAGGPQGLAGLEGMRATVSYDETGAVKTATRIQIG